MIQIFGKVLFVLSTLGSTAFAQDPFYDKLFLYNYQIENEKIVYRGVFQAAEAPNFSQIEYDRNEFTNYPQFLDYLFKKAPSLRKHFVLIHHSQSQQISSLEHPRVILFDGGMAFTFAEDPLNRHQRVEIMEMNPKNYQLNFREILFTESGVQFNRQPQSCFACHGVRPKPIWAPYDFWPTAFASAVGRFATRAEDQAYKNLTEKASHSNLLSQLYLPYPLTIFEENNTIFTQYISILNFIRWFKDNLNNSFPENLRFPLLSALNGCHTDPTISYTIAKSNFLKFFRSEEQLKVASRLDSIYADQVAAKIHFNIYQDHIQNRIFPNSDILFKLDHDRLNGHLISNSLFRTVMDFAGVDTSDLSPNHSGNDFVYSTPNLDILDMLIALYDVRPQFFQGLKINSFSFPGQTKSGYIRLDCNELREKSLSTSQDLNVVSSYRDSQKIQTARPTISRCIKCHVEKVNPLAPFIPFDDTRALALRLRDPSSGLDAKIRDRINKQEMPPGAPLTPQEASSLFKFLDALR